MGILAPIIQILRLPMLHGQHHLAVGDLIRGELVGDQYPRRVTLMFEKCAEEPGRCPSTPIVLDQNVED